MYFFNIIVIHIQVFSFIFLYDENNILFTVYCKCRGNKAILRPNYYWVLIFLIILYLNLVTVAESSINKSLQTMSYL